MLKLKTILKEAFDYRGSHTAPSKHTNYDKPMHDMTDIYPDDIYSKDAARLYGDRWSAYSDSEAIRIIQSARGNPNMRVKIYRAVPVNTEGVETINDGDWVTITRAYAETHGRSNINGKYKILTKTVSAKNLYTDGNSIHEWGYNA